MQLFDTHAHLLDDQFETDRNAIISALPAAGVRGFVEACVEAEDIPKEGLFISLNGYPFLCKPGVAIDIPRPVRLMLDTRITRVTKHDETGKEYTKDVKRINYTLVKEGVNIEEKVEAPPPNAAVNTARPEAKEL